MKNHFSFFIIANMFLATSFAQAIKVEVKKEQNRHILYRNGEPYYINGAGGIDYLEKLKECGGNSIRLWNTDNALFYLDKAHELGLTVTLGLFLQAERMGFNYNNKEDVAKQKKYIKSEILKYKDHPALLMWGIGNEIELLATNPKMFNAINDISEMIHKLDPNHLTTTMLAGVPKIWMPELVKRCKDIDLISINAFKDLHNVPYKIKMSGWEKPYIISEFGPDGYWETEKTQWDAFYEHNSSQKANQYRKRYELLTVKHSDKCLGSYVFFWGQKQERTHTYFSMLLESGKETESMDVMQYLWTGKWPDELAPVINSIKINGKKVIHDVFLECGSVNTAEIKFEDTDDTTIKFYWELYLESTDLRNDGKAEAKPETIQNSIENAFSQTIYFTAPQNPGAYRLFVTLYRKNKVATANVPLFLSPK